LCLSVVIEDVPRVPPEDRISLHGHGEGVHSAVLRYGFMEDMDVPAGLARLDWRQGLEANPMETTYFLGRERLITTKKPNGMAIWRERLFALMSRNARGATEFFHLPRNRVVELGSQVEL